MGSKLRVVSYNVLSSHLAAPSHFTRCDPKHLYADNRFPKMLKKLENELTENTVPTIFCLQEVSHSWAGKLHIFFANRNYHLVTGLYGKKFNGYMGVAIAFPQNAYEVEDVDIARLSDFKEDGWPKLPEEAGGGFFQTLLRSGVDTVKKFVVRPVRFALRIPPEKIVDHWKISENRHNILITCCLKEKDKESGKSFIISNYHMPCVFYAPMVMNIHAEMAVKRVESLATASGDKPHILAGDFNFMPDSPTYQLVTTGQLDEQDATYPTSKYGLEWKSTIHGMQSAYAQSDNGEPDFTNFAQVKEDDPFIGTLDYIFLSKHWNVNNVRRTVERSKANGPFPNKDEPSDHILISADVEL